MRLSGVGSGDVWLRIRPRCRAAKQRGFTLLELVFTIAIIAVLAGIAMPSFFGTSGKARASAEVSSVFSDLRTRLDQYLLENSTYPPSQSESATWPTTPGQTAQTIFPLPIDWSNGPVGGPPGLQVRLSNETELYCGYAWITGRVSVVVGVPNDTGNIGAYGTSLGVVPQETAWYYLFAHCNIDGDSSVDGYYVSDSINTAIRSVNPGR